MHLQVLDISGYAPTSDYAVIFPLNQSIDTKKLVRHHIEIWCAGQGMDGLSLDIAGSSFVGFQERLKRKTTTFMDFEYPLVFFHIAMENGPFIVDCPMKHGDFP